jgi:uncharacterized peroxidase-related enzyme
VPKVVEKVCPPRRSAPLLLSGGECGHQGGRIVGYLREIDDDEADGTVAELYAADRAALGHVANYTRTFAPRPAVYRAWQALNGAIKKTMDQRRYEVATVAAARQLKSSYCVLAHGSVLVGLVGEAAVRDLVGIGRGHELTDADQAVAALAAKVASDAPSITEDDFAELRELGFDDADILDVILAAAARCFFSTVLDATGTLPDAAYASTLTPEIRALLTVGRPIDVPSH